MSKGCIKITETIFRPCDILIPRGVSMEKWSVVACDQFTSEPEYWSRVSREVYGEPSTYNMILPEAYLSDAPALDMAQEAGRNMDEYLREGLFETLRESFVYVERSVTCGVRRGLVGCIDLEAYDFYYGAKTPVRASERTVAERLPARMLIREQASLELPHTIVLIDDPKKSIIEPLHHRAHRLRKLYDFELMEGGGRIRGWQVNGEAAGELCRAFAGLSSRPLQYVIGDGNHSMAAAKELWNKIKQNLSPEERENHPARFFLCEVVNVYDEGIEFEPIHRIIFGAEPDKLIELLKEKLEVPGGREIAAVVNGEKRAVIRARGKSFGKMVDAFQEVLEEYESIYEGTIDYIHDEDALRRLTHEPGSVGFLMPVMDKAELFATVERDGRFPKKSFSIGSARDKRYYLECRLLRS